MLSMFLLNFRNFGEIQGGVGCENDEFCIKNEELCIKNEELCIKMMNFTVGGVDLIDSILDCAASPSVGDFTRCFATPTIVPVLKK